MYARILKIVERIIVFAVYYIVPVFVLFILILGYLNFISPLHAQRFFAWLGWWILVSLLVIKPISIIAKRRLNATYWKMPEGITYLIRGWTHDPILIYIKNLFLNTVYSLSLYFMRLRRQMGITVFRSIFTHRVLLEIIRYRQGAPFLFMSKNLFVWVGIIGLFALFIGFITSNTPAIKLLKRRRKPVQRIAYLAFLAASIHLFFFSHDLTYLVIFFVYLLLKIWERRPVKVKPVGEIKSEPVKSVPSLMAARVINHGMLTDHVLELVVEVHQELVVLPGQWALFSFTDKEGAFTRAYSITDRDVDTGTTLLTFTIKIIGGRSTTLLSTVKIGDTLQIKGIYGKFVLQPTPLPKVFIATGTGVSPLINMATHCDVPDKTLLYSVPYHQDLFYEERIKKIHNLHYEIYITREEVEGYHFGRLDAKKFTYAKDTEFYVCGNPQAVDQIIHDLSEKGYTQIFHEKF